MREHYDFDKLKGERNPYINRFIWPGRKRALQSLAIGVIALVLILYGFYWIVIAAGKVDVSGYTGDGKIKGYNGGIEVASTVTIDFEEFDLSRPFEKVFVISNCPIGSYRVGLKIASNEVLTESQLNGTLQVQAENPSGAIIFTYSEIVNKWAVEIAGTSTPQAFYYHPECTLPRDVFLRQASVKLHVRYTPGHIEPGIQGRIALEARGLQ